MPAVLDIPDAVFSFFVILAFPLFEPVLYLLFGTTPGKWIMNIRVVNANGERLTYGEALKRTTGVVIKGLGLGLPIVTLITHIMAYNRLSSTGSTSWDDDGGFQVIHKPVSALRILGLIGVIAGFLALAVLVGVMQAVTGMGGVEGMGGLT